MSAQARADRGNALLTVADIAGHIGAHEQTVRGWIHIGELKASKFGTRIGWRIRRADVDREFSFLSGSSFRDDEDSAVYYLSSSSCQERIP